LNLSLSLPSFTSSGNFLTISSSGGFFIGAGFSGMFGWTPSIHSQWALKLTE